MRRNSTQLGATLLGAGTMAAVLAVVSLGSVAAFTRAAANPATSSAGAAATTHLATAAPLDAIQEAGAQEPVQLFLQANAAYEAGDFDKATLLYEALLEAGPQVSGWVYYNLGNTYLRRGELGEAISAYRMSQSLLPRHGDVQANLRYARQSIKDAIAPPQASSTLRTLFFWHHFMSMEELLALVLSVNLIFWVALGFRRLRPASETWRWIVAAAAIFLMGSATSLTIRFVSPTRIAVVTDAEVDVHSGTSADTVVRFRLHEGTEMELVDEQSDWLRVELSDGKQGWVPRSAVEIARL